jgi:hypothetical protein
MNTLDQLKIKIKKKEKELRNQQEEKEKEENGLKKIREEVFRVIETIYIELLASRPPPIFGKINESSREEKDLKREILEVLQCSTIVREGFEKTLHNLRQQHFSPFKHVVIIINNSKVEE